MFSPIKEKENIPIIPGWTPDEVDERDLRSEEILGAFDAPVWKNIDPNPVPLFPIKNQDKSSSCVGQSTSKAGGIMAFYENGVYRDFSARFPYSQRSIKPTKGMSIREGMMFGVKQGFALELFLDSQNLDEKAMNSTKGIITDVEQTALVWKAKEFLYVSKDFDSFASILALQIPLVIGIAGTNAGWKNRKHPRLPLPGEKIWYHAIVVPPENQKGLNYGLMNGKKVLVADGSWGPDWGITKGQHILTEEYLPCIYWNFYFTSLPDDWRDNELNTIAKPKYTFVRDLYYGLKNDPDVKILQKCLKFLGIFPKAVPETGNYYSITMDSVGKFQEVNNIARSMNLGYGRTGPLTRAKLNKIFK